MFMRCSEVADEEDVSHTFTHLHFGEETRPSVMKHRYEPSDLCVNISL